MFFFLYSICSIPPFCHASPSPHLCLLPLLVSITACHYFAVRGNSCFPPASGQRWKSVAGVQKMRAMDLNLEAIMVECAEEVTLWISKKKIKKEAQSPVCSKDKATINVLCCSMCKQALRFGLKRIWSLGLIVPWFHTIDCWILRICLWSLPGETNKERC